jgi:hypothetical protein
MTKHNHTQFSFWNETPTAAEVTVDVNTPAPLAAGPTSVAVAEVLAFCPRLLSALPAPATLVCACAVPGRAAPPLGGPVGVIVFTTSQPVYTAASATWPVFTGAELAAVALAAEHDRGSPAALAEWCDRKATTRGAWRLTAAEALGPVAGVFTPRGWSIGRVFARYGLQLIAVEVGDEVDAVAGVLSAGAVPLLAAGGVP